MWDPIFSFILQKSLFFPLKIHKKIALFFHNVMPDSSAFPSLSYYDGNQG